MKNETFGNLKKAAMSLAAMGTIVMATPDTADARCLPGERCLDVRAYKNFEGLAVGAIDMMKKWGMEVTADTLSHPSWNALVRINPETTTDVTSSFRDADMGAQRVESVRIEVKNTDGTTTILTMYPMSANGKTIVMRDILRVPRL